MEKFRSLRPFAVLALALGVAGVLGAIFLLLGTPPGKSIPYTISGAASIASVFIGILWFGLSNSTKPHHTVFKIIGVGLILLVVCVNFKIAFLYRLVLYAMISDGGFYATLLAVNASAAFLLILFPRFTDFANKLSARDREAKTEIVNITSKLEEIEQQFLGTSKRVGRPISAFDRPAIMRLRERSQFLSPSQGPQNQVLEIDSRIQEDIGKLNAIVRNWNPTEVQQFDSWLGQIEEVCDQLIHSFDRRESQLIS